MHSNYIPTNNSNNKFYQTYSCTFFAQENGILNYLFLKDISQLSWQAGATMK